MTLTFSLKMCLSRTTCSVNMAYWQILKEILKSNKWRYRRPFCQIYKVSTITVIRDIRCASHAFCMTDEFQVCRRIWDYIKYPWDDTEATTVTQNLYHTLRYVWDDEKREKFHKSLLHQARLAHHFK